MTALYYESHITIEPVDEDDREKIETIVNSCGFRLAKLLMQKRKVDTPERSKYDTFCTGHSTEEAKLIAHMIRCVKALQSAGYQVWRYKIECVTIDSRNEDQFNLLTKD